MATAPKEMVDAVNARLAEHGLENNLDARRLAVGLAADVKKIVEKEAYDKGYMQGAEDHF